MRIENNYIDFNNVKLFGQSHLKFEDNSKLSSIFQNADIGDAKSGAIAKDGKLEGEEINTFLGLIESLHVKLKDMFTSWMKDFSKQEKSVDQISNTINDAENGKYNEKKYDKAIKNINVDNVMELFAENSKYGEMIAGNDIQNMNLYTNNARSKEKVQEDINYIKGVMKEYIAKNNLDVYIDDNDNNLSEIAAKIRNAQTQKLEIEDSQHKNAIAEQENEQRGIEMTNLLQTSKKDELKSAIEARYNEALTNQEDLISDAENIDFGNGKLDKTANQKNGSCWIHAALNSIKHNPETKAYIENHIYKDENKHMIAIHLPQAENSGLPKPKGDGVYVFSDKQIAENGVNFSEGDGDVTAYLYAVELFLSETENSTQSGNSSKGYTTEGNNSARGFELVFGQEATYEKNYNGIKNGITQYSIGSNVPFDDIYKMINEQKGTATISELVGGIDNHAMSIVGAEDGYLYVEESNNSGILPEPYELVPDSDPPRYKISKEGFSKLHLPTFGVVCWDSENIS